MMDSKRSDTTAPARADSYLPIAVRAYTENSVDARDDDKPAKKGKKRTSSPQWPRYILIIDTETTADAVQRLNFGCYRLCTWAKDGRLICVEEGLFYADDLPGRYPDGLTHLKEYARTHWGNVAPGHSAIISLYSRREFVDKVFWKWAYKERALVVGFNLPFDLSRLAIGLGNAHNRFNGGFSFTVWEYRDEATGAWREHPYRPRVCIKHIDSKRALKGFTRPAKVDMIDQIPEGAMDGKPDASYTFRGHFLDLRTLIFALTDKGHSLASACEAFGVEHGKESAETHGVITPDYIGYCRRDVLATQELLEKVRAEYDKHPINLQPTKAYSPASIAKAYLRAMGVQPIMERQPDFPPDVLGHAMTAYYGGRAECRIRHTPVPVVYCDFLSMYPTVNALMGLWRFITAEHIDVVDATEEIQRFLANVTLPDCARPATWPDFLFFAEIEPDGDVLPARAGYSGKLGEYNIGINPLHPGLDALSLWYAGPDLVASTLLTGKPPRIRRAFRLAPVGTQPGLRTVMLRGAIPIDPATDDFFRMVIEERKRLEAENRLNKFLKVLANSGCYGIFAQIDRKELPVGEKECVTIYGVDATSFATKTSAPEVAGAYCFPPLAALITAAARLMLAMLERCITDMGGTYALCDTDSMAPVATEHGGLVPCEGGTERLPDGTPAIRALSWADVDAMVARFDALKPYDADAVPGPVLEVEKENFDPASGERRQLWCYGISAKRYALYNRDSERQLVLRKWSEHGLGHLLNPTNPDSDDRNWMRAMWEGIVREAHGLAYQWPEWLSRPALTQITTSSPALMRPFRSMNAGKPSDDQIKPFNFILSAHVAAFGYPDGADPARFHLIAPFTADARQWRKMKWTDRYSGKPYRITTEDTGASSRVRVKSYADVLIEYRYHPEWKSLAPEGQRNAKQARGVLQRRPVHAARLIYIGKESNKLEEVEAGMHHAWDEVRNEYHDPQHDPWQKLVRPVLEEIDASVLAQATGITDRQIRNIQTGKALPRSDNRIALVRATASRARERLPQRAPRDDFAALAAYLDRRTGNKPIMRTCPACQKPFAPTSPQQRYCSQRCKKRAARSRAITVFAESPNQA